jgi:hypothetical protein
MIYVLLWLLFGSLYMNYLWIRLDLKNGDTKGGHLNGLVLGLVLGPFSILLERSLR